MSSNDRARSIDLGPLHRWMKGTLLMSPQVWLGHRESSQCDLTALWPHDLCLFYLTFIKEDGELLGCLLRCCCIAVLMSFPAVRTHVHLESLFQRYAPPTHPPLGPTPWAWHQRDNESIIRAPPRPPRSNSAHRFVSVSVSLPLFSFLGSSKNKQGAAIKGHT